MLIAQITDLHIKSDAAHNKMPERSIAGLAKIISGAVKNSGLQKWIKDANVRLGNAYQKVLAYVQNMDADLIIVVRKAKASVDV